MTTYGNLLNDTSQRRALEALLEGTNELPADALAPGSAPRSVADKLGETVSARDFLEPTDASFHSAIQRAVDNRATAGGGGVWIPTGEYDFANGSVNLVNAENVSIFGDGMGATIINQTTDDLVFYRGIDQTTPIRFLEISDMTIIGTWETNPGLGSNDERHISLHYIDIARVLRVESLYCRQMGIRAARCGEVLIEGCRVQWCARDGISAGGSNRVMIVNNTVRHCGDDGIALHTSTPTGDQPTGLHLISGNYLEDSYGIKMLGANRTQIVNNRCVRSKSYSLRCVYEPATDEGACDVMDLLVQGNIFLDVINPAIAGLTNQQVHIIIGSANDNPLAPVAPGSPPTISKPEDYFFASNSESNSHVGGHRIKILDNICAQTLKNGVDYADWGFGEMFLNTGWVDPAVDTNQMLSGQGLRTGGLMIDVEVRGNTFYGLDRGWQIESVTADQGGMPPLSMTGNRFIRIKTSALKDAASDSFYHPIISRNNLFDMDPLFESASRTSPLDGTWQNASSTTDCVPLYMSHHFGIFSEGDTFRNCPRQIHIPLVYQGFEVRRPTLIGDPLQGKGIGSINGQTDLPNAKIMWEDSDPRSNTYGRPLNGGTLVGNGTTPTRGIYMTGQLLWRSSFTASTVAGWAVTTGGGCVTATWASGQSYSAGGMYANSTGKCYTLLTAGGGTTANEPTHDYGEVTGADGYKWRFEAPTTAVRKTLFTLGA